MSEKLIKRYLFASDFDQTLSFNDSGYVLSELLGIAPEEFKRKSTGMAKLNLVQQGAELAYLLLHDPQFRRCRRDQLHEVGKRIPLKESIGLLNQILDGGIDGYHFEFYVLSAAPVEIVCSALEGIVPADHIFGTEFEYNSSTGEIERIVRTTAGYGKAACLDQLQAKLQIGPDHVIFAGDGSSDIHAMLHVNGRDGLTIAVSETQHVMQAAKRTVISSNALAMLLPILEKIVGWEPSQIRDFFESHGLLVQEWSRVRTVGSRCGRRSGSSWRRARARNNFAADER